MIFEPAIEGLSKINSLILSDNLYNIHIKHPRGHRTELNYSEQLIYALKFIDTLSNEVIIEDNKSDEKILKKYNGTILEEIIELTKEVTDPNLKPLVNHAIELYEFKSSITNKTQQADINAQLLDIRDILTKSIQDAKENDINFKLNVSKRYLDNFTTNKHNT